MKNKKPQKTLPLVELNKQLPLVPQIVNYLTEQIQNRILLPEEQLLPPKKQAPLFKVSHDTVSSAYDLMAISGLLYRVPGQGTFVSAVKPEPPRDIQNMLNRKPAFKFRPLSKADDKTEPAAWLQVGLESPEYKDLRDIEFATKYQNAVCSCCGSKRKEKANGTELKSLLVSLVKQRGMLIDKDQLTYSMKDEFTVVQLLHTLLVKGDRAVMVSNADDLYHRLLLNLKRKVSFTGSDDEGMITSNLEQICLQGDVKLVLVRTKVDYERGVALSGARKQHLLELSNRYNFVILEIDDYPDSSYVNDIVPLIALSEKPRIIYVSSLTVTLSAARNFRLIIAPSTFITRLKHGREGLGASNDLALEASLSSFINTLRQPLHVRRFNNKYRRLMSCVLELINSYLSGLVNYCPPTAGFGIWLSFHKPVLKEHVESILSKRKLCSSVKGNTSAVTITALKICFGVLDLSRLEGALSDLSKILPC